jgi:hypothetical protein
MSTLSFLANSTFSIVFEIHVLNISKGRRVIAVKEYLDYQ